MMLSGLCEEQTKFIAGNIPFLKGNVFFLFNSAHIYNKCIMNRGFNMKTLGNIMRLAAGFQHQANNLTCIQTLLFSVMFNTQIKQIVKYMLKIYIHIIFLDLILHLKL